MELELLAALEQQVENLLNRYQELQRENEGLREENRRLTEERQGVKARVDAILGKLEGIPRR
ncbi:MAG TPA: cell division protein ZapB [Geobacteraceae bacterium]